MGVIKPQEINLDFTQNSYKDIVVKQNDVNSRSVIVTCTNNGTKCPLDRVAQTCNIKMETPDGRPIYNPTTILSDGRVQIDFTEQMVLVGGKVYAELEVVDSASKQIIHTMNLHIIIVSNVYPNDAIIASPEFDALNKALLAVQDCSELVESVHEIEENERIREENEAQRAQEFEEMKNAVVNVDEHYNTVASTDVLGHVKVDNESIVIDENGVIRSGFGKVPDGVTYIDFDDSENIDYAPIDQVNGVKIYHTDDDKLMASWDNNGETKEIDLTSGSGGSGGSSGLNDIYTDSSINLGRKADTEIGTQSVAIGVDNTVININSIAIGENNIIDESKFESDYAGDSIIVGHNNTIDCARPASIMGYGNKIINSGEYSFYDEGGTLVAGKTNTVNNNAYHAVFGCNNQVNLQTDNASYGCLVSGYGNKASGCYSVAMGYGNEAGQREASIALGRSNKVNGQSAIALGSYCEATADYALAGGSYSISSGLSSFAYGSSCTATQQASVALGDYCKATGGQSIAMGRGTEASNNMSIAMGYYSKATGYEAIAIGDSNEANAHQTLALGARSIASGNNSIAIGYYAKASSEYQTAMGRHNVEDTENKYALIFGGGEYSTPKNIHTLDWDGNAVFAGNVTDGAGATINGIETASDGTVLSSFGGNIILNSISAKCEQDTTEGYSIFDFYDKTTTSGGVTANIVNGVCTLTGENPPNYFYIDYGNIDLTKLIDGKYIFAKNYARMYAYDASGTSLYPSGSTMLKYDSATIKRIQIQILVQKESYEEGMSFIPMISNKDFSPTELYTGGFPSPNPMYPQTMTFPIFDTLSLENESGNKSISFDSEITLYCANNAKDIITSSNIVREVAKITLTGNEEISGNAEEGYFLYSPIIEAKKGSVNVLSDHYKNIGDTTKTDYNIFIDENGNIRIQHSGFASIDEYKTWLSTNNVEIIYERATAETIELSDVVSNSLKNIRIFSGETTISTDSSTVQPIVEVEYPTSKVGKYVAELKSGSCGTGGGSGTGYVPTKVSEFENDIGYATIEEVDSQVQLAILERTYTRDEIDILLSELFISVEEMPENPLPNKVYLIQGNAEVN